MTDVKRLLDVGTPLPWRVVGHTTDQGIWLFGESHWQVRSDANDDPERGPHITTSGMQSEADAHLASYAVNRLPDYEAAVDALDGLIALSEREQGWEDHPDAEEWDEAYETARTAMRRLREPVPA